MKFEPRPQMSACYNKRGKFIQVFIWFEMMGQDSVSLLSLCMQGVNGDDGIKSMTVNRHFFTLWSLSTTLWHRVVITSCDEPVQSP